MSGVSLQRMKASDGRSRKELLFNIYQALLGDPLSKLCGCTTLSEKDLLYNILLAALTGGGGGGVWGTITGTLSNQLDLQAALDGKEPSQTFVSQAEAEAGTEVAIRSWSPLRVAQAIAALGGGGSFKVKTANYTAVSGDNISADVSGGAFTITLPATPADAAWVAVVPARGTFLTNHVTIDRNGESIDGAAANTMLADSDGALFVYRTGYGWRSFRDGSPRNRTSFAAPNPEYGIAMDSLTYNLDIYQVTPGAQTLLLRLYDPSTGMAVFGYEVKANERFRCGGGDGVCFQFLSAGVARFRNYVDAGIITEYGQVASLGTPSANSIRIGSKDVAGTAEAFVVDEAGNETQFSAHNHTAPATLLDSPFDDVSFDANYFVGLVKYINRTRLAKGRPDFLFVETFAQHNARLGMNLAQLDWNTVEQRKVQEVAAAHASWLARKQEWESKPGNAGVPFPEPEPPSAYTPKAVPSWLTNQLANRTAFVAANAAIHAASAGNVTKRTSLKNSIATLRTWATEATNAANNWGTRTQVQKDAIHVTTFNRLSTFMDRFADLLEAQAIGD